jgi:hypothetical protein
VKEPSGIDFLAWVGFGLVFMPNCRFSVGIRIGFEKGRRDLSVFDKIVLLLDFLEMERN